MVAHLCGRPKTELSDNDQSDLAFPLALLRFLLAFDILRGLNL